MKTPKQKSIELLQYLGYDVSIRLSPFIKSFIDIKTLNEINFTNYKKSNEEIIKLENNVILNIIYTQRFKKIKEYLGSGDKPKLIHLRNELNLKKKKIQKISFKRL